MRDSESLASEKSNWPAARCQRPRWRLIMLFAHLCNEIFYDANLRGARSHAAIFHLFNSLFLLIAPFKSARAQLYFTRYSAAAFTWWLLCAQSATKGEAWSGGEEIFTLIASAQRYKHINLAGVFCVLDLGFPVAAADKQRGRGNSTASSAAAIHRAEQAAAPAADYELLSTPAMRDRGSW
jgi:hypothetical protein